MMIFVDSAIVLAGFVVFRDWRIPLFSYGLCHLVCLEELLMRSYKVSVMKNVSIISNEHERMLISS